VSDLLESQDVSELSKDLKNLPNHFIHEFVKRLILYSIERNSAENTKKFEDLTLAAFKELHK